MGTLLKESKLTGSMVILAGGDPFSFPFDEQHLSFSAGDPSSATDVASDPIAYPRTLP